MTENKVKQKLKLHSFKTGDKVRHSSTGDLYIFTGKDFKRDNPRSFVVIPESSHAMFVLDEDADKLPPGSTAKIAYEADRALCHMHRELKGTVEWASLNINERAKWIEGRVNFEENKTGLLRLKLYNHVREALSDICLGSNFSFKCTNCGAVKPIYKNELSASSSNKKSVLIWCHECDKNTSHNRL